ncbi:MAG: D-tyrosyl-tRNA(Tyr) deacylase [Phycisphaerae bacterium]|nr:D-tyrosyl-tRNA(Tyr) deacylase [Phycisphaerae bacterium]
MRAVVQRVSQAEVRVADEIVGRIENGLLVYAAAAADDTAADVGYIADKVASLRIFMDSAGKMNLSVQDVGGSVLVVSAFTVMADARKGRRPSFDASATGEVAEPLINQLVEAIEASGLPVQTGRFAAKMQVPSTNEGPICILLDSRRNV